jgi:hypothetical protein
MFHDIVQAHALLNHAQFTSLDVDVKDLSVAKVRRAIVLGHVKTLDVKQGGNVQLRGGQ